MTDIATDQRVQAYIGKRLEGLNPNQARIAAGYPSSSAATRLENDDSVRAALKEAAIAAGGTFQRAAEKLIALWDAERMELSRDGSPVNLGPDNRTQVQAVELYLKMMGGMPKPGPDIDLSTQNVLVIDSAKQPLAALDPFAGAGNAIDAESVQVLDAPSQKTDWNPEGGIAKEDDFLIG